MRGIAIVIGPVRVTVLLFLLLALAGCGGRLPNGRGWGQDATIAPGWERVKDAAVDAVLDPATWVPAGASLAFQIDDVDRDLSDWAVEHTPVFGSTQGARDASTFLHGTALAAYLATVVATPARDDGGGWAADKLRGVGVGAAAVLANYEITMGLKHATDRLRPDGSNRESFPSAHTSGAAVYAMLAARNTELLEMPDGAVTFAKWGLAALDVGTGWARVEGGRHYPSDVLAGMALGHFVGAFFTDAFLGLSGDERFGVFVHPDTGLVEIRLGWSF
jgi:membrane-associated phospholipid phosphatase